MTYEQIKSTYLPSNPTRFDYLHAIRAMAARREHHDDIFLIASEGMGTVDKYRDALNKLSVCLFTAPESERVMMAREIVKDALK